MSDGKIKLYALSTCMWCKKTRALLDEEGVEYECIYVNQLEGDERASMLEEVEKHNESRSFPTLVAGDVVVVGFKPDDIRDALSKCKQE